MTDTLLAAEVYDHLQRAMASDPDGFRELYRDFLAEARQCLDVMRTAFTEGNSDQLRQQAHYVKGSTQVLGLRSLTRVCELLEEAGKTHDLTQAPQELAIAEDLLQEIQTELIRRLGPDVVPKSNAAA